MFAVYGVYRKKGERRAFGGGRGGENFSVREIAEKGERKEEEGRSLIGTEKISSSVEEKRDARGESCSVTARREDGKEEGKKFAWRRAGGRDFGFVAQRAEGMVRRRIK